MSTRRAAAWPSSASKYKKGQVCSMPMTALLIGTCTVPVRRGRLHSSASCSPKGLRAPGKGLACAIYN